MARILVVEDNPDTMQLVNVLLKSKNHEVMTKNSGKNFLETVIDFMPEIVLMDMRLSGDDGLSLCRQMKESSSTNHIPVIIISGQTIAKEQAAMAGADYFLAKPFAKKELLSTISTVTKK